MNSIWPRLEGKYLSFIKQREEGRINYTRLLLSMKTLK